MKKLITLLAVLLCTAASQAQVTFTGTASDNAFENRAGHNEVLDGNLDTKWEAWPNYEVNNRYYFNDDNGNVLFKASSAIYVNGITLTTAGDTQTYSERNPYQWTLFGSNDDAAETDDTHSSWRMIKVTNDAQMPASNKTAKYFKFSPSQVAYKYFKFHVNSLVGKDELQLAEIALDYSLEAKATTTSLVAAGAEHYGAESADKLFDGDCDTKWCKHGDASTNWVVFKTTKPIYALNYMLRTANDSEGRDPKKFKLYAALDSAPSTDGSTAGWTLIDSEEDASSTISTNRKTMTEFSVDAPEVYQYFLFKVDETRDNNNEGKFQLSEIVMNNEYEVISSDADMSAFAEKVNAGDIFLNAVLAADVNSSTSIGTESNMFTGTIEGLGHKVNLSIDANAYGQGFIGVAKGVATVKNLILTGSVRNTNSKTGGFIAEAREGGVITIANCGNEANITGAGGETAAIVANNWGYRCILNISNVYNIGDVVGTGDVASICACQGNGSSVFTNVYNAGSVTGDAAGKFVRSSQGTYTNCYSTTTTDKDNASINQFPSDKIASGKLCYLLNGSVDAGTTWTQTIGKDSYPIPFSIAQTVSHASTDCYTNLSVSDEKVQLRNMSEMIKFAQEVEAGNTAMHASVTADIDMSAGGYSPIGTTDNKYSGTFDGQGHVVTLNISSNQEYQGLIGCATGGAVIQNVITRGYVNGSARCGGILGGSQGSGAISILNCGNEANITTTGVNAGGVHGCNNGSGVTYTLINCYNAGTVKGGSESAGISGWLGNNATVTNCYNIGEVTGVDGTKTFARWESGNYVNCYNRLSANSIAGRTDSYPMDKVRSGELCNKLGSAFTQDLSQEGHPSFGSKAVIAGKWFNDAENDVYYNKEGDNYTVYQLNLDETKSKYSVPVNVTAKNISISREIPAGQWIGLCLPFDYDIPSGWDVREFTDVSGSGESTSMKFSAASGIEAGKPYLVKPTEAVTTISASDKTLATSAQSIKKGDVTMVGNLGQTSLVTGDYYINKSSQLKHLTAESATLKGFRAYFTVDSSSGVKALSFDLDDDATAIQTIDNGQQTTDGAIYNVAGQRLNKMQKGINIVNGKKILF